MDMTFGEVQDKGGEEFHSVFTDDCTLSTPAYDGDTDDDVVNRHIEHSVISLATAKTMNIQSFWLEISRFAHEYINLLGFKLGRGLRFVDPSKAANIESWPLPSSIDDIVSFRA